MGVLVLFLGGIFNSLTKGWVIRAMELPPEDMIEEISRMGPSPFIDLRPSPNPLSSRYAEAEEAFTFLSSLLSSQGGGGNPILRGITQGTGVSLSADTAPNFIDSAQENLGNIIAQDGGGGVPYLNIAYIVIAMGLICGIYVISKNYSEKVSPPLLENIENLSLPEVFNIDKSSEFLDVLSHKFEALEAQFLSHSQNLIFTQLFLFFLFAVICYIYIPLLPRSRGE